MFIDLNFDDLLRLFQLLMIKDKKLFHSNDNIINFSVRDQHRASHMNVM